MDRAAGAGTTESATLVFFLAMALYPEAQQKAQEELDRVVGSSRLPDFSDRDSLPYVNALIKEILRWHVGIPISLPHASIQDDIYNGYLIPGGSIVISNLWYVSCYIYRDTTNFVIVAGRSQRTQRSTPTPFASTPTDF